MNLTTPRNAAYLGPLLAKTTRRTGGRGTPHAGELLTQLLAAAHQAALESRDLFDSHAGVHLAMPGASTAVLAPAKFLNVQLLVHLGANDRAGHGDSVDGW